MTGSLAGRFAGRVAVVIGGTSGIGLATARRLHDEGATLVVAARREDEGAKAAALIGERAVYLRADVTDRATLDELFSGVAGRHGRLDVMVNSAGLAALAPADSLRTKHWERGIAINLHGVFHACQAALPSLRSTVASGAAPSVAIVNVLSISGMAADRGFAAYNAAKAGALNLTRTLALEWAAAGIRVNAVSPGAVDTPMATVMTTSERATAAFGAATPLGRFGRPDEIAAAITFLAADEASFITGANLVVDGGVSITTGQPDMLELFGS